MKSFHKKKLNYNKKNMIPTSSQYILTLHQQDWALNNSSSHTKSLFPKHRDNDDDKKNTNNSNNNNNNDNNEIERHNSEYFTISSLCHKLS